MFLAKCELSFIEFWFNLCLVGFWLYPSLSIGINVVSFDGISFNIIILDKQLYF